MKNYKVIVADCDGTLTGDNRLISSRTKQTLTRVHNNGLFIVLASGRSIVQIKSSIKEWDLPFEFDGIIGLNGCELLDNIDKITYQSYVLSTSQIKEIVDLTEKIGIGNCAVINDNGDMLNMYYDESVKAAERRKTVKQLIVPKEKLYEKENAKVLVRFVDEKQADYYCKQIHLDDNCVYYYYKTRPEIIEFSDKRVNKANAFKIFCEKHNINSDNTIAFGDTTNDNELIKMSGLGVCLLNGSKDTKQIANLITDFDCDNDGLAICLESILNY